MLLVVEDDETFGRTLLGLARDRGFRGVVATSGAQALDLARTLNPDAITLDLRLPDMDGWVVLDQLKHDPRTRHIPVHVISALDDERRGLEQGALAFLQKTADLEALGAAIGRLQTFLERKVKRLLVVEDDDVQRKAIVELIGNGDVITTAVASAEEALASLDSEPFDCVVLDLKLPGMSGFELITTIKERPNSQPDPDHRLHRQGAEPRTRRPSCGSSPRPSSSRTCARPSGCSTRPRCSCTGWSRSCPPPKREMLRRLAETDPSLAGKKVLLVDDDARNLFALTTVLEQHAMKVVYAENGQQALDKLKSRDRRRCRADGHHDARDGRLRGHPPDPGTDRNTPTSRSSPSPPRR